MMTNTDLPVPRRTPAPEIDVFWERAGDGVLVLPVCESCDSAFWYPRAHCPRCGSTTIDWVEASGLGRIYTYTVVGRGMGEYKDVKNYVLAYVELAEGPRILTNIVEWDQGDLAIDRDVEVVFSPAADGSALPRFRPVRNADD